MNSSYKESESQRDVRITRIELYELPLSFTESEAISYGPGLSVSNMTASTIRISTNVGLVGYGEIIPFGSNYMPAFNGAIKPALLELGPKLIGQDPTKLLQINDFMDQQLKGHPYIKTPIDMACWDILGKVTKMPVCDLMGGRFCPDVPLTGIIHQNTPEKMVQHMQEFKRMGFRNFQLKVGSDTATDIDRVKACAAIADRGDRFLCDANTSWTTDEALCFVAGIKNIDNVTIYIEQPCTTINECYTVRQKCERPMILDESIVDLQTAIKTYNESISDIVKIKLSRVGGMTKAKVIRDACATMGIKVAIEDGWTTDLGSAALSHMCVSMPQKFFFATAEFKSTTIPSETTHPVVVIQNGHMKAPSRPGLGVEPIIELYGKPILDIE